MYYFVLRLFFQMAVVITDGNQTKTGNYTKLSVASQGIKNKGVTVYAVGIGSNPNRAELEEIASRPENVLTSASFRALQTIAPQLRKAVCDGKSVYLFYPLGNIYVLIFLDW